MTALGHSIHLVHLIWEVFCFYLLYVAHLLGVHEVARLVLAVQCHVVEQLQHLGAAHEGAGEPGGGARDTTKKKSF